MIPIEILLAKNHAERFYNLVLRNLDIFLWTSGFQNLLARIQFNMFVDDFAD